MLIHRHLLDTNDATAELREKTLLDIERQTALTWGARAAAAYQFAQATTAERRAQWLADAANYRQECLEHAAMTEDIGFLKDLTREIDQVRT